MANQKFRIEIKFIPESTSLTRNQHIPTNSAFLLDCFGESVNLTHIPGTEIYNVEFNIFQRIYMGIGVWCFNVNPKGLKQKGLI